MPVRAGQIVVEMTAGTRTFVQDVEVAKTKLREFGATGETANVKVVSATKATSASIKAMEGGFANNNKAAAAFINTVLGGGKVMQAVFPIVGGLAFAGMLETVVGKVQDFFKKIEEAPGRVRDAFQGIYEPLEKENDELRVTNDKLAEEIGKLSGRPGNGLQLALHEAWVVADKLEASVAKTLKDLAEVQKKEGIGALNSLFTGRASTTQDEKDFKQFQDAMTRIDAEGQANVRAAKTKEEAQKAQAAWNEKALKALDDQIERYKKLSSESEKLQRLHEGKATKAERAEFYRTHPGADPIWGTENQVSDQSVLLNERQGVLSGLMALRDRYALAADEASMQGQLPALKAAEEARKKQEQEWKHEREEQARQAKAEAEDWARLIEAREKFKLGLLTGIEKINAEEEEEVRRETERARERALGAGFVGPVQFDPAKREYIRGTFDLQREKATADAVKAMWYALDKEVLDRQQTELNRAKKDLDEMTAAKERVAGIDLNRQRDLLTHRARIEEESVKSSGLLGQDAVNERYRIRVQLVKDLEAAENERIAKEQNAAKKLELEAEKRATVEKARADAEEQRERELAELRQKDVRDFFEEMRTQAETAGHVLYNALHSALDQASDQLAKLVMGQKADFRQTAANVAEGMVKESIKSAASWGLGKIGDKLGIHTPKKHDGSSPDAPLYVKTVGGSPLVDGKAGTLAGLDILRGIGGSDSEGGEGGGFLKTVGGFLLGGASKLFGGFMAEGGDVDPGSAYIVGEHEAEVFTPRTAGSITPMSKLGIGGSTFHVDARGADLGAGNRVMRAIEAAKHAAAAASMAANAERMFRTPQRSH